MCTLESPRKRLYLKITRRILKSSWGLCKKKKNHKQEKNLLQNI